MQIKKLMCCASICMLVSSIAITGQAADKQIDKVTDVKQTKNQAKVQPKVEAKVPIVIEADKLSFSDLTGDLFAEGHVSVVQDGDKLLTEFMRGNSKQTELWIDGKADFFQLGTKLTGTGTHYNYTSRVGNMNKAIGKVGKDFISGVNMDFSPTKLVAHDGTMTECPAIVPDYHVSAKRIEIWPGDKMIAYNAKFWIKNVVIFTLPKYQVSLKKNEGGLQQAFPRLGYNNQDGFSLKQHIEYPISGHVTAFTDLWYYSRAGFKPQVGLVDREKNYAMNLIAGDYRDTDGHWVTKEPELKFDFYSHRLGKLPVSYTFSALYGKWTDATKSSWHQDYNLYFTRDTISLNKTLFLNMGAGVEQIRESYNGSVLNSFRFNTSLVKVVSPKIVAWTGFNYSQNNTSLFEYNNTALSKEWVNGFSYKMDKKNTVVFNQSYDLQNKQVYSNTYTWNRDLHCWQLAISYIAYNNTAVQKNRITMDLTATRW